MNHYTQVPLSRLPRAMALRLIDQLTAPEQRFARCFERYWREVVKLDDDAAARATAEELAAASAMLRAGVSDACFQTIGVTHDLGYEPVGIYAVRALTAHPVGAKLAKGLGASHERRGIVHALAIRDDHGGLTALRTAFFNIARRAEAQGFDVLYFYSSDHRLAGVYRRFGMEFSEELALPESGHLVGRYSLRGEAHQRRMREIAEGLGLGELTVAA